MQPEIHHLIEWSTHAGQMLNDGYGRAHQVRQKSPTDVVTEIDQQVEDYLVGQIRAAFPDHSIVAEEGGETNTGSRYTWQIDPLDGTVNYTHGLPFFSTSIAYLVDGVPQLGVVNDPQRGECFSAARGQGLFLNGEPAHVSANSTLLTALLGTGFPYDLLFGDDYSMDNYNRFAMQSQGVRRLGSAALAITYVACGRLDGYWELKLSSWDIAAACLLVQEAGGVVTDAAGSPDYLRPPFSIVTANPLIHPLMLQVLQSGGD